MASTSRNVLAVMVIMTLIISLIGTITAISVMMKYGDYRKVPVSEMPNGESGKVSVYLAPSPMDVSGHVSVSLLTSEEGG